MLQEFSVKAEAIKPGTSPVNIPELVALSPDGLSYDPSAKTGVAVHYVLAVGICV